MYINPIQVSEAVSLLCTHLKNDGLLLDYFSSQEEFSNEIERSGKKKLGENMCLSLNSFSPACFFGVVLKSRDGQCIASVAARKDNLGGQNLGDFLRSYWGRLFTSGNGTAARLSSMVPSYLREPQSEVAYIGELWVHPERRDLKSAKALVKLAILLSVQLWGVSFIYAFLTARHMKQGPIQYGWTRAYQNALRWERLPCEIPSDLGFVAITGEEASELAGSLIAVQG